MMTTTKKEPLSLWELDTGITTHYRAAPVISSELDLLAKRAIAVRHEKRCSMNAAIYTVAPNVDNGAEFICTHDLRQAIAERVKRIRSASGQAGVTSMVDGRVRT